jgi:hypothetical protein
LRIFFHIFHFCTFLTDLAAFSKIKVKKMDFWSVKHSNAHLPFIFLNQKCTNMFIRNHSLKVESVYQKTSVPLQIGQVTRKFIFALPLKLGGKTTVFIIFVCISACWTMATKMALTPTSLEEQVLNHIALAASSSQPESVETTKNKHAESMETDSTQPQTSEAAERKEPSLACQQPQQRPSSSDDSKQTGRSRSNSSRPSKTPSTDQPMSLKNLQEMVSSFFNLYLQNPEKLNNSLILGTYDVLQRELGGRKVRIDRCRTRQGPKSRSWYNSRRLCPQERLVISTFLCVTFLLFNPQLAAINFP